MSDEQKENISKIHKLPFIIKKEAIKKASPNYGVLFRCMPGNSGTLIKEDILYQATENDFFQGKYPALRIVNRLDVVKNNSRTVASYTSPYFGATKLTSDAVVNLIGQANYDQVFASLCSVINQELKIKGILALLCASVSLDNKAYSTVDTQTYESSFTHLMREKQRRTRYNKRSKVRSYIVQESVLPTVSKCIDPLPKNVQMVSKRVVVNPADCILKHKEIKVEVEDAEICTEAFSNGSFKDIKAEDYIKDDSSIDIEHYEIDPFPELNEIVNEDSDIADVGSVSNLSIGSDFSLSTLEHSAKSLLNYVERHTEFDDKLDNQLGNSTIGLVDGSMVTVKGNPDPFHVASPDILRGLSPKDQKKIMIHQAYLDWKFCLQRDHDENLPIHLAVLNNDVDLVRRQCLVLKSRNESVDIMGPGNLTALQMAILQNYPDCTAELLAHGADMMVRDDESRTTLHLAAEICPKHVQVLLDHSMNNARELLKENEDLWKPELENKPESKLINYLLSQLNMIIDNQGYTPLMLASKLGNAEAVHLLVKAAPRTVNMAMPTCGNTALYLAAGAACTEAANRGDKTKIPENYKKTVEILVENGADPAIENNSGSNVHFLLTELHDITLSFLIARKLSAYNGFENSKCGAMMLVKDAEGVISVTEMNKNSKNKAKQHIQPKVYSNGNKTITVSKPDVAEKNDTNTKSIGEPGKNCKNNTTVVAKNPAENVVLKSKPMILKNLPVITKIASFGSEKPVLVKDIVPKSNNKGLLTQLTPKTFTTKPSHLQITSQPKYLKILPKPEPETSNTTGNKLFIVKHNAVKRFGSSKDIESGPSSSKIHKT